MYGETLQPQPLRGNAAGLSPHVRGNLTGRRSRAGRPGSIPACTGKPPAYQPMLGDARVYPRMYGETSRAINQRFPVPGLSPHVRGNPAGACAITDPRMYGETFTPSYLARGP